MLSSLLESYLWILYNTLSARVHHEAIDHDKITARRLCRSYGTDSISPLSTLRGSCVFSKFSN